MIRTHELHKRYGETIAVDDVSFTAPDGRITGLLGPNGAGKTTTVEHLEGFKPRAGGEARVLGEDPQHATAAWRGRIGVVLQESSVERELTVREVVELYAGYHSRPLPVDDGTRIDSEVRLNSVNSILRQTPRALEIGLFAPFPNMWLRAGKQVGYSGRLIAGFETLLTYVIESMALLGWWRQRRNLAAWLLAIFIGLGTVALGLVVNNMGAMYRLRYPFWVLMVGSSAKSESEILWNTSGIEVPRNLFDLIALVNLSSSAVLCFATLLTRITRSLRLRGIDSTIARRYRRGI